MRESRDPREAPVRQIEERRISQILAYCDTLFDRGSQEGADEHKRQQGRSNRELMNAVLVHIRLY